MLNVTLHACGMLCHARLDALRSAAAAEFENVRQLSLESTAALLSRAAVPSRRLTRLPRAAARPCRQQARPLRARRGALSTAQLRARTRLRLDSAPRRRLLPRAMAAAEFDSWDAETCAAALDGAGFGLFGSTPRRRRGVDWEAAALRMDCFVSALRDAGMDEPLPAHEEEHARPACGAVEATPRRRRHDTGAARGSPDAARATWRAGDVAYSDGEDNGRAAEAPAAAEDDALDRARRAPAAHAYARAYVYRCPSGDENEGVPENQAAFESNTNKHDEDADDERDGERCRSPVAPPMFAPEASARERALHARLAALEGELRRARLAGALREMRAACGDLAGATLAQAAAAGSPGAAPRRRAEEAEAVAAEARAERDAALARCATLEERLATATDTIALLRRRLEAAEASGSGGSGSYTAPQQPQEPPASARVREAVAAAVAAVETLPAPLRRRRLRSLRLRWHPDKHGGEGGDALAALATEVTQALNEQVEAMQRRVQLRGSDDDASDS